MFRLPPGARQSLLAMLIHASLAAAEPATEVVIQCEPQAGAASQCRVSRNVYQGWRIYHSVCNHCHGQDALGSTFAPNLLVSMRRLSYREFRLVTEEGTTSSVGVMPGYKDNPNVARWIDELYSYLRVRAEGRLPTGRPQRNPEPG